MLSSLSFLKLPSARPHPAKTHAAMECPGFDGQRFKPNACKHCFRHRDLHQQEVTKPDVVSSAAWAFGVRWHPTIGEADVRQGWDWQVASRTRRNPSIHHTMLEPPLHVSTLEIGEPHRSFFPGLSHRQEELQERFKPLGPTMANKFVSQRMEVGDSYDSASQAFGVRVRASSRRAFAVQWRDRVRLASRKPHRRVPLPKTDAATPWPHDSQIPRKASQRRWNKKGRR